MQSHTRRWPARPWKDGDTYLVFGAFAVVCLASIAWHAAHPANWVVLKDVPAIDSGPANPVSRTEKRP